ncbi:pilus assembly protein TadG-related protein [Pararhizobium sp.]|uniref:pilus assembly protein TadG-related protein n=1 Tax=Pararhizobium sp. TaxID=1977563 RepID=UPI0027162A00|nr:pilus assembly protein TadG-related protein [Pararhizobium sp.]MDO9418944.1 pilus assembly protein TadG-related protein [Pararhizobium sp.]
MLQTARHLFRSTDGNIAVAGALVMPLMLLSIALGVDYAYLSLQRRNLQATADLAAIAAAANVANRNTATLDYFRMNGLNILLKDKSGVLQSPDPIVSFDASSAIKMGIATVTPGRYVPNAALAAGSRFSEGQADADAVRMSISKEGEFFIAGMFAKPPVLTVTGTAARTKVAAFSVGSRLASLNDGLLNAILGQMLGTTVSLNVMDYNALVDADIEIQPFLKLLATDLNLTTATYEDVLQANLTIPKLLKSMRGLQGLSATTLSALKALNIATSKNNETFTLAQILNIDPKQAISVDAGSNWLMKVSALKIISAAASLANGKNQIAIDTGLTLPGLASVTLNLAIGEPPVQTPSNRLGAVGSAVRTAQTRLGVNVSINGLTLLAGLRVDLPLYVEVAYAEAQLADIRCYGGAPTNAAVSVDVVPGIAEIAIGKVDPSVLSDFSKDARVVPARLVDSLLLKIDGIAHVEAKNLKPSRLDFSPAEIARGDLKNVSTKDALTSATQTLLNNLDVDIKILMLTLGTPKALQNALAQTLAGVTPQVDQLIYNLLLLVGVKIGEADVRVTGVGCQPSVLVQ